MEENERTKIADCNDVKQTIVHPKGIGRGQGTVGQEESAETEARHRKG